MKNVENSTGIKKKPNQTTSDNPDIAVEENPFQDMTLGLNDESLDPSSSTKLGINQINEKLIIIFITDINDQIKTILKSKNKIKLGTVKVEKRIRLGWITFKKCFKSLN